SWTRVRKSAHEDVRTITVGARIVVLDEDVVSDDRHRRSRRYPGDARPRILELDLHVVADRVEHDVVLDETPDEGIASVRVSKIEAGTRILDGVASDDPAPGRHLRRDRIMLLAAVV